MAEKNIVSGNNYSSVLHCIWFVLAWSTFIHLLFSSSVVNHLSISMHVEMCPKHPGIVVQVKWNSKDSPSVSFSKSELE